MTISSPEFSLPGNYAEEVSVLHEQVLREDAYHHFSFTEQENPQYAAEAQRIHAEGYRKANFVEETAVTEDGRLERTIDKSRGDNVKYYLGINKTNEDDCATIRIVSVPEEGSFKDLPAYKIVGDAINPLAERYLESISNGQERIKEVSAMATSEQGKPLGAFEVMRAAIHDALGKNEVWFFGIVTSTHDSLTRSLAPGNMQPIGEDVPVEGEDVVDGIKLRPVVMQPDTFLDELAKAYIMAERSTERMRYAKNLVFFADGLSVDKLNPTVATVLGTLQQTHKPAA